MKYRYLGRSGLLVSRITLGTMTFGTEGWGCDEKTSHAIMKHYIDAGGNFIDTADIYAGGRSEEIIGSFLQEVPRDDIVIASKSYFPMGQKPNQFGSSKKHLIASCEASLRRLKTDHIDLYYIHGPDPVTPLEETMRGLDDLVSQGKVRYIGCSNFYGWQITKADGISSRLGYERMVASQHLYNLIHRDPEREIIPAAIDAGVGMVCYSPLGGGFLTGKYKGMSEPGEGSRLSYRIKIDGPRSWNEKGFQIAEILEEASSRFGIPLAKIAIAWPLGRDYVSSVIIGVKSTRQLEENMESGEWELPEEVWTSIEEQTRPHEDYLTWFNKLNYDRSFNAAEKHDRTKELP